ncbi:hypothetical protein HU200_035840 [Digitaria exilis]|uniref:Uncharacterized protein n=1 Tax=Digitaria exilis TaxID=1010633 RepID=A0A835BHS3_9POAL|nr:hypothetical protein HU200_035840 [Digitaria exilis]
MASRRAAAAEASSAASTESERKKLQDAADKRWLQTLSEPELDLLIGLKELAVTRASNAGHPHLADRVFHLRALRALAFVLLEECKERLRQASSVNNTSMLERLALLDDPDHEEVVRPGEDLMPVPTAVRKKRKQMQDGYLLLLHEPPEPDQEESIKLKPPEPDQVESIKLKPPEPDQVESIKLKPPEPDQVESIKLKPPEPDQVESIKLKPLLLEWNALEVAPAPVDPVVTQQALDK